MLAMLNNQSPWLHFQLEMQLKYAIGDKIKDRKYILKNMKLKKKKQSASHCDNHMNIAFTAEESIGMFALIK